MELYAPKCKTPPEAFYSVSDGGEINKPHMAYPSVIATPMLSASQQKIAIDAGN